MPAVARGAPEVQAVPEAEEAVRLVALRAALQAADTRRSDLPSAAGRRAHA
jgi:hypothetical protein